MIFLGKGELAKWGDFGRHASVPEARQFRLESVSSCQSSLLLFGGGAVDRTSILSTDVVALTIPLGWIMILPEDLQDVVVGDDGWVEHDENDFCMVCRTRTDCLVGRRGGVSTCVPDRGRVDSVEIPEQPLGTPKAAHADDCDFQAIGEGGSVRRPEHVVGGGKGTHATEPTFGGWAKRVEKCGII